MIYFIHNPAQQTVKIGTAIDVTKRFYALQCANSEKLILLGRVPGERSDEQKIHARFHSQRVRGEWFHATVEVLSAIESIIERFTAPFRELCEIEPELMDLFQEAQAHQPVDRFCANAAWYGYAGFKGRGLKTRLTQLVGIYGEDIDSRLRNSKAWDIAYDAIYEALPDCQKGCACKTMMEALLTC